MDIRIVVRGPSKREFRREIEQAALREARRKYPDTEVVISQRSLDQVTRDVYKPIENLIRGFK